MTDTATTTNAPARHHIGGQWVTSAVTGTSFSPADGSVLGTYYEAETSQVEDAIRVAKETFATHAWRTDRQLRARVLTEMADRLEAATDELALLLARENGKVLPEAYFELSLVPSKLRYYAAQALTHSGRGDQARKGVFSILLSNPVGVAGVIVPWNSPVVLAVRSFAPAMAAGCTVVMKMAAQTALVNARMTEILTECPSLPAGVLNVFTESGSDGAKLLVSSPDVAALSYTGSTTVGRQIMADAGSTLKRLSLELGGKTPMIIFDDAEIEKAVGTVVAGITTFAGQFCMTGSRVLVHSPIADRVRSLLTDALESVKVGPGDSVDSQMGPMVDVASRDRLDDVIEKHLGQAEIIVRGGRPKDPALAKGAYYRPVLLGVQDTDSPLVQTELFGPVATLEVFETEEEAVRLANATEYGLSASVWTQDGARGLRMADALDAGTVWTNGWAVVLDQFEEGGAKQSGLGRLNGHRAVEEFQEYKHIVQVVGD
jgi:betaine-aldehyde dehydrogenase